VLLKHEDELAIKSSYDISPTGVYASKDAAVAALQQIYRIFAMSSIAEEKATVIQIWGSIVTACMWGKLEGGCCSHATLEGISGSRETGQ
jgi:hypothetical protein